MILAPEINSNVFSVLLFLICTRFVTYVFVRFDQKRINILMKLHFFCIFSFKISDFWWNRIASIFSFSEKIKNLVLQFISAQNVAENHEFSMKTIYKPTTFCGEGFLGLDSIQLLQNSQKIYFSCSLLNYKICVFFTPNTSSKMELSIV